jgi:hypothetical protein
MNSPLSLTGDEFRHLNEKIGYKFILGQKAEAMRKGMG